MLQRHPFFSALFALPLIFAVACGDDDGDDVPFDGAVPPDGFLADGEMPRPDGSVDPENLFPAPQIIECPADPRGIPADLCEVTAGGAGTLITADILTPGVVYRDGKVLVAEDGTIACVGCDCAAGGASELYCPEAVLSPGLINGHDHLSFNTAHPYGADDLLTDERYEHRHEWRGPENGHTRISAGANPAVGEVMRARSELRHLITGTTSINSGGSSVGDGMLRNLDDDGNLEGLAGTPADYDTFPLGSSTNNVQVTESCDYQSRPTSSEVMGSGDYVPHVSEGISQAARNEFTCIRDGMFDVVEPAAAFIHGVGLNAADIAEMATSGVELIWSPRTNISLYGDTARVSTYARLGATIALGTDWLRTGSMNMLRELACADSFNQDHLDGFFPDEQLWLMATRNAAQALGFESEIGTIADGLVADLALYDGRSRELHRAVIAAEPQDVLLVMRGGQVLYGDSAVVGALRPGCSDFGDTCGRTMQLCLQERGSQTFTQFEADAVAYAMGNSQIDLPLYPLFFCGEPANEPSCLPARVPTTRGPGPMINGSNVYTGMSMAGDPDGDGIADGEDNCPLFFNPIRPMDGGMQADFDADGIGDECDICPVGGDADPSNCVTVDPNDRDGDGVPSPGDNCANVPNPGQEDMDSDGVGDACDSCPMDANPGGGACPATIYEIKQMTVTGMVSIESAVVTAAGPFGFTVQVSPDDPAYEGAEFSGLYVYTGGVPLLPDGTPVTRGMNVDATGGLGMFGGQLQFARPTVTAAATSYGLPTPVAVSPMDIAAGSMALAYESVLVTVDTVTVSDVMETEGEFTVDGTLVVDDLFYRLDPFVTVGEVFDALTGVLVGQNGSKLNPRDADDVVAGDPALATLLPGTTFVRVGGAGASFPEALTVGLTRAPAASTLVMLSSSGAGLTVSNVTLAAGMRTAPVSLTATVPGTYTVTATLGADSETATVRVLGAAEQPGAVTLDPDMATVNLSGMRTFTVRLDIPAPPGGTVVTLTDTTGGTAPAAITVPANALSAPFIYAAPASATTGTLTAALPLGASDVASISVVDTPGTIVINEVDYDQPGTDGPEYLELYNPGSSPVDLAGLQLILVNGSNGMPYGTLDLGGVATSLAAGQYLVVHASGVTVPAGALVAAIPGGSIQNGGPDGIALWDSNTNMLLDALSYEGSLTGAMIGGMSLTLVEGTATTAVDMGAGALARIPNGVDTDDADSDWVLTTCLTPGAANTTACP